MHPSATWRYRVTVEIETPEGLKIGSAVHQISIQTPLIDWPDIGNPANFQGEAVVVDLGERGKVFTLISNQSWQNGLYQAFPIEAPTSKKGIETYKKTIKPGMTSEWKTNQPTMVTFSDLNNPLTVEPVYSQRYDSEQKVFVAVVDRFKEIFGQGVGLKRIIVETTEDPITWGLINSLPWLHEYYNMRLDGNRYGTIKAANKLANGLSSGSFTTQRNK